METSTRANGWTGWGEGTPLAYATRIDSLRWRLLLQIDAVQDGELLLNQDGGFFYIWITGADLATHNWRGAIGTLQCH